ncbi:MAG: 50S ribosomal protein L9 [Rhodobiaceae bacterium]|nr:50S ribosomal protein L9 [Rhodobiaceae bacterium]MCC0018250.1 50S ribosomal protein L9 [Rhodobiaceae bacterium]MCC0050847.1 50S ribosomal protein L9 [Rhodobiaceae bacterium]MCC0060508.1 50S ribosomal protein L9 [Rhodobiaceae bacterium]
MDVILLERIPRLGQMGDIVKVKNGYARNFLLPQGKALRATEDNKTKFENERAQLEARNLELRSEAEKVAEKLEGQTITLIRQAGTNGQLYGSVTARDIAEALTEAGFSVGKAQVMLHNPIKGIGISEVGIRLHAEVETNVSANVARSEDEAERQARGEDIMATEREEDEVTAEAFFEDAGLAAELDEELADDENEAPAAEAEDEA